MKKLSAILLFLICFLSANVYADDIKVLVNDKNIAFSDVKPQIIDGRTMVPVRALFDALGAEVHWDSSTEKITGSIADTTVVMQLNSKNYKVNGLNQVMDCYPVVINGRTLTPARYVAESLGYRVDWDSANRTVLITRGSFVKIHFVDVGQGDCTVITDNGHAMVIDAGDEKYGERVVSYIKNLGISNIDYVIATHPHSDHIGGLDDVIESFDVKTIIMPNVVNESHAFENLLTAIEKSNASVVEPKVGNEYKLGNSSFMILGPENYYDEINNISVAIRLMYDNNSIVMTGDAESEEETDIVNSDIDIKSDVLKIGHHGSSTSTSIGFLNEVNPETVIICVGDDNSYGHPAYETLEKLNGKYIYRTDTNGNIIITFTGSSYNVAVSEGIYGGGSGKPSTVIVEPEPDPIYIPELIYEPEKAHITGTYIINTNTKRVHLPDCASVKRISDKNKKSFSGNPATLTGYTACQNCKPF